MISKGPDLTAYGEEVEKLLAAAADIRSTCSNDVRTGLYIIRTAGFKSQLAAAAEAAAAALLELLRTQVSSSVTLAPSRPLLPTFTTNLTTNC